MKYVYELIGAFFLMFTVGMTVLDPRSAGVMVGVAIGSVLAVMVYAGGHLSGGHYNPAVSLAVYLRKKMDLKDLGYYWAAQFAGAVLAALLTIYFKGHISHSPMHINIGKALIAEFLFTFALCYVVLNTATARGTNGNSYFGLAIGFTVLAGVYAVGSISGAAFNPSVAIGISILNITAWANIWIYFVANLLAAALAAYVFRQAHPGE